MNFWIFCITNWNMKHPIFWILFTKYIWLIQLFIEFILSCHNVCLNSIINNNKPIFDLAVWTSNLNSVIFCFNSKCFTLVIYYLVDDMYFSSVWFFLYLNELSTTTIMFILIFNILKIIHIWDQLVEYFSWQHMEWIQEHYIPFFIS